MAEHVLGGELMTFQTGIQLRLVCLPTSIVTWLSSSPGVPLEGAGSAGARVYDV